jgi:amino acid adenylation domain-containing protein
VGYFINPVILRADLSGDPLFTDLLDQVQRNVRADFEHDAYPYPLVVERIQPGRGSLFQIFYSWQKTTRLVDSKGISAFALNAEGELQTGKLSLQSLPLRARVTPTDLALLAAESDDELALTVEYSTELFEAKTVERLLGHLQVLLDSVSRNPEQPISGIPLLTSEERSQILEDWSVASQPATDPLEAGFVHEWIQDQARRAPQRVAVSSPAGELTYASLQQQVEVLAARLRMEGVTPGMPVGVCLERSPESIVSLLAVLKAGGAYLPLDPEYPAERLQFMLVDSGAHAVITQKKLLPRLAAGEVRSVCLDERGDGTVPAGMGPDPGRRLQAEDLCYIMYTSGSTGWPKGVMVSHRAIAHHCRSLLAYYDLTPEDGVLQFASPSFDASLEQIFTCLMAGARLELRDVELWDPAEFSSQIARREITVVNVPPAYWQEWVLAEARSKTPIPNPQLRLVILGGDIVHPRSLALWQQTGLARARLINAYGPTEAVITATAYDIPPDVDPSGLGRVPIGRPLAGRRAYILEPGGEPAPAGVPGELCLGGVSLALGYHGQPELTAQKFPPDLFHTEGGARTYRTGDMARWRWDGNIEFLGRLDRQVKIRGIRIELEEIETVLKKHLSVAEAAVTVQESDLGDQLVACVVADPGKMAAPSDLAAYLARQLPVYMVPSAYVLLESLPLTPGGKPDREALKRLAKVERGSLRPVYTAPRNPVEGQVAEVWKSLLCIERVGAHDNFFNLGGHSLLAAQLVSRLREAFQVDVPLQKVFAYPTVAGQALVIAASLAGQQNPDDLEAMLTELEAIPDDQAADELNKECENA